MHLQITTKCNFLCGHCCYSCNKNGKHMPQHIALDAIRFASNYTETIAIGGGEPTLHPDFDMILAHCLNAFGYTWLATNGSRNRKMEMLYRLLTEGFWEIDEYRAIQADRKRLAVTLSNDYYHKVFWTDETYRWERIWRQHRFELRDVTVSNKGVIRQGRAAKNNDYMTEGDCVCSTNIIKPSGGVYFCGCKDAPKIGTIWGSISEQWMELINEARQSTECFKSIKDLPEYKRADKSKLSPQLIGLEGWRVEVVDNYNEKRRFIVRRSTGWMPIHLEVKTRRSLGGGAADKTYKSVRKLYQAK